MGDEQQAAITQPGKNIIQYALRGLRVEPFGGFVEHQDRRILEDRAGDGDPAELSARQSDTGLAHLGRITFRLRLNEVVDLSDPAGLFDGVLAGIRSGQQEVVADRGVE